MKPTVQDRKSNRLVYALVGLAALCIVAGVVTISPASGGMRLPLVLMVAGSLIAVMASIVGAQTFAADDGPFRLWPHEARPWIAPLLSFGMLAMSGWMLIDSLTRPF
ncbi:MAG: hypothetical protein HC933_20505 [Pleurocapsa sp. SU_196_0]|nr:hypothetical protein [Pleurocapsa sp. SU_196_0]